MVSRAAQEELRRLRTEVDALGHRVRRMLPVVTEILTTGDEAGARRFLADAGSTGDAASCIEADCEAFLALQAPVAAVLRHAVGVVRIGPEYARSADLMANICKATLRLGGRSIPVELAALIAAMSAQAEKLLAAAVNAHETQVLALADALADMDDHLDETHRQFVRRVVDARRGGEIDADAAVQLAMVARFYERLGDHAVNVGAVVRFEIEGEMGLLAAAEAELDAHDATN